MIRRQITSFNPAQPTTDGAGVAIQRVAVMGLSSVDPVLMIDELKSPFREDFQAGFPAHPHRGMQTLTYMLAGGIAHEDSMGNRGEIREGGVQWMSAGSGVIHSDYIDAEQAWIWAVRLRFVRESRWPIAWKMGCAWGLDGIIVPILRFIPATLASK